MSIKNRTTILTDVNTNLADNSSGDISASDVRTVFTDLIDSVLLREDSGSIYSIISSSITINTGSLLNTSTFNSFTSSYNTGSFNGSFTGSLFGTASWSTGTISASYALTSSFPIFQTGSSIATQIGATYSVPSVGSVYLGSKAGSGSIGGSIGNNVGIGLDCLLNGGNNINTIAIGRNAGKNMSGSSGTVSIGAFSGESSFNSQNATYVGQSAGYFSHRSSNSVMIGYSAGYIANDVISSIMIGDNAGYSAFSSSFAIMIGLSAGENMNSGSRSILVGAYAGRKSSGAGISSNNIIIGNSISLPNGRTNSINIGGIIFGTGSYAVDSSTPSITPSNGRIGINVVNPTFTLEVSGSGRYTNSLIVTGSIISTEGFTGSLFGTASWALNTISASYINVTTVTGSASYFTVETVTSSIYALSVQDSGKYLLFNSTSSMSCIVTEGIISGFNVTISQEGSGEVVFNTSGSTSIYNRQNHTRTAGLYANVSLICKSLNTFNLVGDTAL